MEALLTANHERDLTDAEAAELDRLQGRMVEVSTERAAVLLTSCVPAANRMSERERRVSLRLRQMVWKQFDGRCAYCRSPHRLMDGFFEIDHIIPVVAGGMTAEENLALACPYAIGTKDARGAKRTWLPAREFPSFTLSDRSGPGISRGPKIT